MPGKSASTVIQLKDEVSCIVTMFGTFKSHNHIIAGHLLSANMLKDSYNALLSPPHTLLLCISGSGLRIFTMKKIDRKNMVAMEKEIAYALGQSLCKVLTDCANTSCKYLWAITSWDIVTTPLWSNTSQIPLIKSVNQGFRYLVITRDAPTAVF